MGEYIVSHLKFITSISILLGLALSTGMAQADYQNQISAFNVQTTNDSDSESNLLVYSFFLTTLTHQENTSNTLKTDANSNTLAAIIANKDSDLVFYMAKENLTRVDLSHTVLTAVATV